MGIKSDTKNQKTILRTEGLKKYFGEVHAVDNVDLRVNHGEILSIIGPNGSGKTTLLNLISNMVEPDEGKVFFYGKDVTKWAPSKLARMGLVRSFQIVNLFDGMSVLDNMKASVVSKLGKTSKPFIKVDKDKEVIERSQQLLELFKLSEKADSKARDIPHGDRKVLDVALCFALDPKLILLDEPTSGVGTSEKTQVIQRIEEAVRKGGVTAVIVEHDMDVVFSYSNKVVAMHRGRILAEGKPKDVKKNKEVIKVVMGEL
ncbi:MAG: ABC transporter ATP-binding protein [Candidatus Bathyarchaeota archaeon]|nr:ABC transporter ATP-binding protein [Candidatus Bathyarchaeota archaeon]